MNIINNTDYSIELFNELHDSRLRSYKELSSPAFKGVWDSVMDLYPESAHFLFELLQNADDAMAGSVKIVLYKDGLIFKHDGKIHFTVTPVAEEGSENLGHINSITSIGNSTKQDIESNKIGKFGLGFKSVFQYCETPEIYDDVFKFKLEHKIIPTLLDHDHEQRCPGETLFYFPFISPTEHYKEINESLKRLENSTLFLNSIKNVSWCNYSENIEQFYNKTVLEEHYFGNIKCQLYNLSKLGVDSRLWMFTRNVRIPQQKISLPISIGFYINEDGQIITKDKYNVSCFFETSESFESCFVSHAPFLLTNNRSQIKNNEDVNKYLVSELGELLADVLSELRNMKLLTDNLFEIIGKGDSFDYSLIGPSAIYRPCKERVLNLKLFQTRSGDYLDAHHVFLPSTNDIRHLFTREQLQLLTQCFSTTDFLSDGYTKESCDSWREFKVDIVDYEFISSHISSEFMKQQSMRWISTMFTLIVDRGRSAMDLKKKNAGFLVSPIIKTDKGEWFSPFKNGELNIYFPTGTDADTDYNIVDDSFSQNKNVKKFLDDIGCKEPDRGDYIKTKILQSCNGEQSVDIDDLVSFLEIIYDYSQQIEKSKYQEFCSHISESSILFYKTSDGYRKSKPSDVLLDTPEIQEYAGLTSDLPVIDSTYYKKIIDRIGLDAFHTFLKDIHISTYPKLKSEYCDIYYVENYQWESIETSYYRSFSNKERSFFLRESLEGLNDVLLHPISLNLSKSIWSWIIQIGIDKIATDTLDLFYYTDRYYYPISQLLHSLLVYKWLYNAKGELTTVENVSKEEIESLGYEHNREMLSYLGIKSKGIDLTQHGYTEEDNNIYNTGKRLKDLNATPEEFEAVFKQLKENKEKAINGFSKQKSSILDQPRREKLQNLNGTEFSNYKDLTSSSNPNKEHTNHPIVELNLEEQINKFKEVAQKEIEKREAVEKMRQELVLVERYSCKWFKSLLELEYGEKNVNEQSSSRTISISFGRVSKEEGSERIFVLKNPSRCPIPIPIALEEIAGFEVKFSFSDREDFVKSFEVASVRDFTLRLKAKQADIQFLNQTDWSKCTSASIDANNPVQLMGKLITAFNELELPDNYNLKDNLQSNISFVFGPPGTGKTTHLATKISSLINENSECHILVLCPTNKACDVLTEKLYQMNDKDTPWLGRFVATASEYIENNGLVWNRDSRKYMEEKCCVISTIARLPYDGFSNSDDNSRLKDYKWDYVIIDEASMIPLAQIVYALYKFDSDTSIIIAGDPMQITPIVHEEGWMDENIYSMVNLTTFDKPKTEPIQFEILNLDTQYRSVPAIGRVFSEYSYSGLLNHFRKDTDGLSVKFNGKSLKPLTLIPFKVSRMDNVFRPYKLSESNVHIYSVLLVSEICRYISKEYSNEHTNELILKIGVICPYVAEAQMIDKIIEQMTDLPTNVQISVGTIHGFQGDECDIIFLVLNPPRGLKYVADKSFLNNHNILNVAISRAKNHLFLLFPSNETDGFKKLEELNHIGRLMCENQDSFEYLTCDSIEEIIFGQSYHIENNVFVTAHQLANVYTEAAKKYEIRIDESSVDVQIAKD